MSAELKEARREHQNPQNWNYRRLRAVSWGVSNQTWVFVQEQWMLLTAEPSLPHPLPRPPPPPRQLSEGEKATRTL